METIRIDELIPIEIKEIKSGSELMLMLELDRYTREILGKRLDITGIGVVEEVRQGQDYSYIKKNRELELKSYTGESIAEYTAVTERRYFQGDISKVVYEKQTDDEWVYSYYTDTKQNRVLNNHTKSSGYVSLYAYMVVRSYEEGKPVPHLRLRNGGTKIQEELEYVDILILKNMGNKLLEGRVDVEYASGVVVQPEWEAYVYYQRQRGLMLEPSTISEKSRYMQAHYKEGDVMLYYRTEKRIESRSIRRLISCYPAIIRRIGVGEVEFDYYPIIEVKENYKERLKQIENKLGEQQYTRKDFNKFIEVREVIGYEDVGVGDLSCSEDRFLLPMQRGVDTFEQRMRDKDGRVRIIEMDAVNLVYAVFEDRGVRYNRERYKSEHFKQSKAKYDIVMGR